MEYKTKEEVLAQANTALHKTLREIIPEEAVILIEKKIGGYGPRRKGFFGELVEKYVFGIEPNTRPEADFATAGVELKTNPLKKHSTKTYVSKERLVFSMIDYVKIIDEKWESSTFLKKNKVLLLMFYLYVKEQSILDYDFKFVYLLDLLEGISAQDVEQIKADWEFIVEKIRRGEAHLLSEADTYYLGACTKATVAESVREQPGSLIRAKRRAFSLKQTYLNYLIQEKLLGKKSDAGSIYAGKRIPTTIESIVADKFKGLFGKSDVEIMSILGWVPNNRPKNFKRLLVNRIMTGKGSNRIKELEKANVEMRVITLEHTGTLRESLSFPAFDYKDLIGQDWENEDNETMSELHALLETKRFLFVIFRKLKNNKRIVLEKVLFWNFPVNDLGEAERVFNQTKKCIEEGRYNDLPKMSESPVLHVRPHGKNSGDTITTPQNTQEIKRCFWLNAKYVQKAVQEASGI